MINKYTCEAWPEQRRMYGDLFAQPGRSSTVVIQTEDVTLHVEYRQESERCDAHTIDVWISSMSMAVLEEPWEGVIGETKDLSYQPTRARHTMQDRKDVLKHAQDAAYEVNSPFATRCTGCFHH
jgi:hypothetical protein